MKGSVFFLSLVLLFNFHNFAEALCINRTTTLCPDCNRLKTDIVSLGTTTFMELTTPVAGVHDRLSTRLRGPTTTKSQTPAPPTVPPTPPPTTMPTTTQCETTIQN